MTLKEAMHILQKSDCPSWIIQSWNGKVRFDGDGKFTLKQVEAMGIWMRHVNDTMPPHTEVA